MSRVLHVLFVEIMRTEPFRKKFPLLALEMRAFLEPMIRISFPATKITYKIMKRKDDTHTKPLERSMFARSPDATLKKIGTEQVQKILRASLSVEKYCHKDSRVQPFFFSRFREGHCPVTFHNSSQYL